MRFEDILKEASRRKASDVYLITGSIPCINIDGHYIAPEACPDKLLSPTALEGFARSIMTPEQWHELQVNRELNIAYMDPKVGRFRVNALWQRGSLGLVMRRVEMNIPTIKGLGLPPILRNIALGDRGIVLVCGATGSGKSTTMASMLDYRNRNYTGHIVTIEDPIEFIYKHKRSIVTQREVGLDTESFEEALKNTLRQAPKVISIGEMRTQDTVQFAMHAAETGHLVFATLHSTNAVLAVERIMNFYPAEMERAILMQMSLNIRAIICQRLVPTADEKTRCVAIEVLNNGPRSRDMISKGSLGELRQYMDGAHSDGTITFDQSMFNLVQRNLITESDALSHAESENNLQMKFKGMGLDSELDGNTLDPWAGVVDPYELPEGNYHPTKDLYTNDNSQGMLKDSEVILPEASEIEHGTGGEAGRKSYGGSRVDMKKLDIEPPAREVQEEKEPKTGGHRIHVQHSMQRSEKLENRVGRMDEEVTRNAPLDSQASPLQEPDHPTQGMKQPAINPDQSKGGSGQIADRYRRMINEGLPESVAEDLDSELDEDFEV